MLIILSPSKTIKLSSSFDHQIASQPQFIKEAEKISAKMKQLSLPKLQNLLKTSTNLTQIAHDYFQHWQQEHNLDNSTPSIVAFNGDVFAGMESSKLSKDTLLYSQHNLVILSALYGALRPLDLIQPYRLDVANSFLINNENLYQYWKIKITKTINKLLNAQDNKMLINLASTEYFKMVDEKNIPGLLITPTFKDFNSGKYKIVSLFAKRARGKMTKFILENQVNEPEELKTYSEDGYYYSESHSSSGVYTYLRG